MNTSFCEIAHGTPSSTALSWGSVFAYGAFTRTVRISKSRELVARSSAWSLILALLLIAACGGNDGGPKPSSENRSPSISGSPPTVVRNGDLYDFTPTATDPDADALTFSVSNDPSWITFDPLTGRLQGTPGATDVGTYPGIVISISDGLANSSLAPFSITVTAVPTNNAPSIDGSPTLSVVQGTPYSFTPIANDPDGDQMSFSIESLPRWATFDDRTGTLQGTPGQTDVGVYTNITISVSDGQVSSSLGPFSIIVTSVASGSVTLNWTAPTRNADGSSLNDLSGYIIYWGTTPDTFTQVEKIDNPGITTYVLSNLTAGTYYIVIVAVDLVDNESAYSNVVSATVP